MDNKKILQTDKYENFKFSKENRDVNLSKSSAKKLRKSMKKYGWIDAFPMLCHRNGSGEVKIVDGQHRFSIARELGIPVKYVLSDTDVEVSEINEAQDNWSVRDYLNRWQKAGKEDYAKIDEFSNRFDIPLGLSIAINAGTATFGNVRDKFQRGDYKIKTPVLAEKIGNTYNDIIEANPDAQKQNFVKAIYKCYYVDEFKPQRLVEQAKSYPSMIQSMSKVDEYLDMIEEVYNHAKKSSRIPLAFLAREAMRERHIIKS